MLKRKDKKKAQEIIEEVMAEYRKAQSDWQWDNSGYVMMPEIPEYAAKILDRLKAAGY